MRKINSIGAQTLLASALKFVLSVSPLEHPFSQGLEGSYQNLRGRMSLITKQKTADTERDLV